MTEKVRPTPHDAHSNGGNRKSEATHSPATTPDAVPSNSPGEMTRSRERRPHHHFILFLLVILITTKLACDQTKASYNEMVQRGQAPALNVSSSRAIMASEQQYIVRPNDTLSRIGGQTGCSVNELSTANHIANPNIISVGQVLTIPRCSP